MILFVIVVVVSLLSPGDRLTVYSPVVGFVSVSYHFGHGDHCAGTWDHSLLSPPIEHARILPIEPVWMVEPGQVPGRPGIRNRVRTTAADDDFRGSFKHRDIAILSTLTMANGGDDGNGGAYGAGAMMPHLISISAVVGQSAAAVLLMMVMMGLENWNIEVEIGRLRNGPSLAKPPPLCSGWCSFMQLQLPP